jgi:serine/threonine protein kinase
MIANKYDIISKINEGAFGILFKGKNIRTGEEVAIKAESKNGLVTTLKNEATVYQYLGKLNGFPQLKWFGTNDKFNYLVIDLLGDSLTKVIQKYKILGLKTALLLGLQMIQRIQKLHEKCLLHRDIKPDNFLLGQLNTTNKNTLYLIDFGFCKRYDYHGKHIRQRNINNIVGSTNFVSLNVHKGVEPSRRDDIESCIYVICYMLLGNKSLWFDTLDVNILIHMKEQLLVIKEIPNFIKLLLKYVRQLDFDNIPDYNFMINLIENEFILNQFDYDAVYEWD